MKYPLSRLDEQKRTLRILDVLFLPFFLMNRQTLIQALEKSGVARTAFYSSLNCLKEMGLEAIRVEQKGTMAHIWPEIHTVTTFYRVDVASGDVEMNDEHSDYRWITENTGDLHPVVREMMTQSGIF